MSRQDFQHELENGLQWLDETNSALQCEVPYELEPQRVEEDIKKLQVLAIEEKCVRTKYESYFMCKCSEK